MKKLIRQHYIKRATVNWQSLVFVDGDLPPLQRGKVWSAHDHLVDGGVCDNDVDASQEVMLVAGAHEMVLCQKILNGFQFKENALSLQKVFINDFKREIQTVQGMAARSIRLEY